MKTICTLLFVLLCAVFCSGTPVMSINLWETTANYCNLEDDKMMSLIHQKLSKISAYENVKQKVCPENQSQWGVWKNKKNGKIIFENNAKILPWNNSVAEANELAEGEELRPSFSSVFQFDELHDEMKPFVRCLNHCFDLSAMLAGAVQQGKFFLIKSLVDAGVAVNDDMKRVLPLPWQLVIAIGNDETDRTAALIRLGALNAKDYYGRTALHLAAMDNSANVATILIKNVANKEAKDNYGRTALHMAINSAEVATILIKNGSNKEAKDNGKHTALHWVAYFNTVEVATILIENGANKDAEDEDGRTALHRAAEMNSAEVATILIKNGANKEVKNHDKETALQVAEKLSNTKVKAALEKYYESNS